MDLYKIQLKAMSMGTHVYDYHLDNDFFQEIGGSEFHSGSVNVHLSVEKTPHAYELNFRLQGIIQVGCDRCLEDMDLPINTTAKLFVKLGQDYSEETDEIIIIPSDEGVIDISWYLYEFIALAIPIQHVHAAGQCDESMADKLDELLSNDQNTSTSDEDQAAPTDPRWDALKKLIDNN